MNFPHMRLANAAQAWESTGMKLVYDRGDPETERAIRQVVLCLARGEQPTAEMDVLPAIDFEYAECLEFDEGETPQFVLTPKGMEAARNWRSAN